MSYTKTAILPVTPDEAFALVTQPERLRRRQTLSARVVLRRYPGVGHDFGLGVSTPAEGWMAEAVAFWEGVLSAGWR